MQRIVISAQQIVCCRWKISLYFLTNTRSLSEIDFFSCSALHKQQCSKVCLLLLFIYYLVKNQIFSSISSYKCHSNQNKFQNMGVKVEVDSTVSQNIKIFKIVHIQQIFTNYSHCLQLFFSDTFHGYMHKNFVKVTGT